MKKFLKIIAIILVVFVIIAILIVQKIDRSPYQETRHFAQFRADFAETDWHPQDPLDSLEVGWSVVNMTPAEPVPMAGYGARWGKKYKLIHDSVYVRAMALKVNPARKIYLVSADLLIIPPNVTLRLDGMLRSSGISLDDVYLGATHTHTSIGGWGQKLLGQLFAGKFDIEMEKHIAERLYQAILKSSDHLQAARLSYWETDFPNGVSNRLKVNGTKEVDAKIRGLEIVRSDSTKALMISYQAHTTLLRHGDLELTRDYPGFLEDSLQANGVADFTMFFAGSVGSMASNVKGDGQYGQSKNLADSLVRYTTQFHHSGSPLPLGEENNLSIFSKGFTAPLPAPHGRISKNLAIRPWLFKSLFGISPAYIKVTRIGDILLLGMPADFSGEIMKELDAYADAKGLHLIITSFNGEYIGYLTHDRWYDEDLYETTTMSWFGYQASGYMTEVAKSIIREMAEN